MKNYALLALALLVSLPACNSHNKKKTTYSKNTPIEQQVDMFSSVEEEGVEFSPEDGEDVDSIFDFDEEAEEFIPAESLDQEGSEEEAALISWVDSQADDEFKKLYFGFNKYGLKGDQKASLEYNVDQVKQLIAEVDEQARPTIVIEGHACQEGDRNYNIALSEKRAKAVADLFVAAGVEKEWIKIVGRGSEMPVVINGKVVDGTREDRAPNRRVEVHVIYT